MTVTRRALRTPHYVLATATLLVASAGVASAVLLPEPSRPPAARAVDAPTPTASSTPSLPPSMPPAQPAGGAGATAAPGPVPVASAPAPRPAVAALKARLDPDVFVQVRAPLSPADVTRLLGTVGGTAATTVATGGVHLGAGTTMAIGVDPSSYRSYAPKGTAESTPLWQAVAGGDAAVAHTVAQALAVPLGGQESIQQTVSTSTATPSPPAPPSAPVPFRVGAFATTGLPGVGVVVDRRFDAALGLVPDTGLILVAPGKDPVVTAALVAQTLGATATATPLRVPVSGDGHLTWVPPAVGPITSPFGDRPDPRGPGQREFHAGIDIGAPFSAPIYAASAGTVVYSGPAAGFGNEVVLQHTGDVQTVYGHMERILVPAGATVRAGQPIALVGSQGESTGPHLHFEVHVGNLYTDPLAWLVAHGVKVDR